MCQYMHVSAPICRHDLIKTHVNPRQIFMQIKVILMLHPGELCLFVCLFIFGNYMASSFLQGLLNSSRFASYYLKTHISCNVENLPQCSHEQFSTKAPKNQRPETLICNDMLIYSLELLHWPWMGHWLCVLLQCLPEFHIQVGFILIVL